MTALAIVTFLLGGAALVLSDCNKPEILANTYLPAYFMWGSGGIKDAKACFKICKDYLGNRGTFCEGMTYKSNKLCYLHWKVEDDKIKKAPGYPISFARNEKCPSKFPNCYPEIRHDIFQKGNILLSKKFESVEECYQYCKDLEVVGGKFCAGISFREKDKMCYLHSKAEDCKLYKSVFVKRPGLLFAKNAPCEKETVDSNKKIEYCGLFPNCYPEIRHDIAYKGNDLLSKTFESVEECYQYCKDLEAADGKFCAGITFKEKDKRCRLHGKVEECNLYKNMFVKSPGHLFAKNAPCEKETVNSYEKIECGDLSCLDPGHTLRKWSGPSKECAAKTKFREFTQAGKDKLVKLHNEYRQKIAAGKETEGNLEGVESSNMRKVIWNDELAMTAQRWTDQCTFGHDKNRGMCDGTYAGQNGAMGVHKKTAGRDEVNDNDYVTMLYNEVKKFNASQIEVMKWNKGVYAHFSQVVWADSYMIGCGITTYMKNPKDYWMWSIVMCNYGPGGNWLGSPLYKIGEKCSECPKGTTCDTTYDALC